MGNNNDICIVCKKREVYVKMRQLCKRCYGRWYRKQNAAILIAGVDTENVLRSTYEIVKAERDGKIAEAKQLELVLKWINRYLVIDVENVYGSDYGFLLRVLRWPAGIECPSCRSSLISKISNREKYQCGECAYQFSVTARTIFHRSKLSLDQWVNAIRLVRGDSDVSSRVIAEALGINYKTAWKIRRTIRKNINADTLLGLFIERVSA